MNNLGECIRRFALECGYADCGFAAAGPFEGYERRLQEVVRKFPGAASVYRRLGGRGDVRGRFPWARSIVVCLYHYGRYRVPGELGEHIGRAYLFDRRVNLSEDHAAARRMGAFLRKLGMKVRKGGVPDRQAAVEAGLGFIGRNTFFYSPHYGSWVNIETWLVNVDLVGEGTASERSESRCPPGCTRCIDACPSGALVEPFLLRPDRCVAYLTYGDVPLAYDLHVSLCGGWVYGCDACQLACPLNRNAWVGEREYFSLESVAGWLTPRALASMDEMEYAHIVYPRFFYLGKEGAERWRRNAEAALRWMEGSSSRRRRAG